MSKIRNANKKIEEKVVGGYKKVENTVVSSYKKIEDEFVDMFLRNDNETIEEAKERIKKEQEEEFLILFVARGIKCLIFTISKMGNCNTNTDGQQGK